jgi:ketosteroid isomerase-like protein
MFNARRNTVSNANVSFVQGLYAAFGRGEIPTIIKGLAPEVDWNTTGRREDFPTFGPRKGPGQVDEFFKTVAAHLDFSEFSPREFYAVDDKVFVLGYYAMTLRKNARKVASDWVHIFTIRDGKVVKFKELLDTAVVAEAYRA